MESQTSLPSIEPIEVLDASLTNNAATTNSLNVGNAAAAAIISPPSPTMMQSSSDANNGGGASGAMVMGDASPVPPPPAAHTTVSASAFTAAQRRDQTELENRTAFHAQVKAQLAVLHSQVEAAVAGRKGIMPAESSALLTEQLLGWIQAIATPPPCDVVNPNAVHSATRLASPHSAYAGASAAAAASCIAIPDVLTGLRNNLFAVVSPHTSVDAGRLATMATTLVHVCAVRCNSVIQYRLNKVLAPQQQQQGLGQQQSGAVGGSPVDGLCSAATTMHFAALTEAVTGLRQAIQIIVDFAPYVSASTFSSSNDGYYNYAAPATKLCIMACSDALKHHFKIASAVHSRVGKLMGVTGLNAAVPLAVLKSGGCSSSENDHAVGPACSLSNALLSAEGGAVCSSSSLETQPTSTAVKTRAEAILTDSALLGRFTADGGSRRVVLLLQELSDIMRIPLLYLLKTVTLLAGKGGLTACNAAVAEYQASNHLPTANSPSSEITPTSGGGGGAGLGNSVTAASSNALPPTLERHMKICLDIQSLLFQLVDGAARSYGATGAPSPNGAMGGSGGLHTAAGTPTSGVTNNSMGGGPAAAATSTSLVLNPSYTGNGASNAAFSAKVSEKLTALLFRPPLHQLFLTLPSYCGDDDDGKLLALRLLQETVTVADAEDLRAAMADHEIRKAFVGGIVAVIVSPHESVVESTFATIGAVLKAAPLEACQELAFMYCTVVTRLLDADRLALGVKELVLDHFIKAMLTPMVTVPSPAAAGDGQPSTATTQQQQPLLLYLFYSFDLNPYLGNSCNVISELLAAIDRAVKSPSSTERRLVPGSTSGATDYPLVTKGLQALSQLLETLSLCVCQPTLETVLAGANITVSSAPSSASPRSIEALRKLRADRQQVAEDANHNPVKVLKKYFKISDEDFNQHTTTTVASPPSSAADGGSGGSAVTSATTTTSTIALDKTKSLEAKDVPPCPPHLQRVMSDVVDFLMFTPAFTPAAVGEFLSDNKIFALQCCRELLGRLEFRGHPITYALCEMLTVLQLPKEGQRIERLLEFFAEVYFESNVERRAQTAAPAAAATDSGEGGASPCSAASPPLLLEVVPSNFFPYENVDATYVVTVATVMLNTDLHNPRIATKMTKKSFGAQLKGCNNNKNFPDGFGDAIFDAISRKPLSRGNTSAAGGDASSPTPSSAASPNSMGSAAIGGGRMDMFFFSSEEHKEVLRALERQKLANTAKELIDRASSSRYTDTTALEEPLLQSNAVAKALFEKVFGAAHKVFLKSITEPSTIIAMGSNEEALRSMMAHSLQGLGACLGCAVGFGYPSITEQCLASLQRVTVIRAMAPAAYGVVMSVIAGGPLTNHHSNSHQRRRSIVVASPTAPMSPTSTMTKSHLSGLNRFGWAIVFRMIAEAPKGGADAALDRSIEGAWAQIVGLVRSAELLTLEGNTNATAIADVNATTPHSEAVALIVPLYEGFMDAIIRVKPSDGLALGTYCAALRRLLIFSLPLSSSSAMAAAAADSVSALAPPHQSISAATTSTKGMSSYAFTIRSSSSTMAADAPSLPSSYLIDLFVTLCSIHATSDECLQVLMETLMSLLLEAWVVSHGPAYSASVAAMLSAAGSGSNTTQCSNSVNTHFAVIRAVYESASNRDAVLQRAEEAQAQLANAYANGGVSHARGVSELGSALPSPQSMSVNVASPPPQAPLTAPSGGGIVNIVNVTPMSPLPPLVLVNNPPLDASAALVASQRVRLHAIESAKAMAVELLRNSRIPRGGVSGNGGGGGGSAALLAAYEEGVWSIIGQVLAKAIFEPSTVGTEVCSIASAALRAITSVACDPTSKYWGSAGGPEMAHVVLRTLADVAYIATMCADLATARLGLVQLSAIATSALNNSPSIKASGRAGSGLIRSGLIPNAANTSDGGTAAAALSSTLSPNGTSDATTAVPPSAVGAVVGSAPLCVGSECLFATLLCLRSEKEVVRTEALHVLRGLMVQLHQDQIEETCEVLCHIVSEVVLGYCPTAEHHCCGGGGGAAAAAAPPLVSRLHVAVGAVGPLCDPYLQSFYRLGFAPASVASSPANACPSPSPSSCAFPSPMFSPTVMRKASRTVFLTGTLQSVLDLLVRDALSALTCARVTPVATSIVMSCLVPIVCSGRSSAASRSLRALAAKCITDTIGNCNRNSDKSAVALFKNAVGAVTAYVLAKGNDALASGALTLLTTNNTISSSGIGFAVNASCAAFAKEVADVFAHRTAVATGAALANSAAGLNVTLSLSGQGQGQAAGAIPPTNASIPSITNSDEGLSSGSGAAVTAAGNGVAVSAVGGGAAAVSTGAIGSTPPMTRNNSSSAPAETREALVDANLTLLAYLYDAYGKSSGNGLPMSREESLVTPPPHTSPHSCQQPSPVEGAACMYGLPNTTSARLVELLRSIVRLCGAVGVEGAVYSSSSAAAGAANNNHSPSSIGAPPMPLMMSTAVVGGVAGMLSTSNPNAAALLAMSGGGGPLLSNPLPPLRSLSSRPPQRSSVAPR